MREIRSVADMTAREIERCVVCIHEAAHAVVGVVLGGRVKLVTVGGLGGDDPIRGAADFDDLGCGHHATVAAAGPWAAAAWRYGRRPTLPEVWAATGRGCCGSDGAILAAAGGSHAGAAAEPLVGRLK